MDTMDTNITPQASLPTTAPATIVAAQPMTNPTTSMPMAENGGNVISSLKNLNWIEIGFGILGATALYYAIYYYRYNINQSKSFALSIQNRLDELDIKLADVNSVFVNEQQPPSNNINDTFLI